MHNQNSDGNNFVSVLLSVVPVINNFTPEPSSPGEIVGGRFDPRLCNKSGTRFFFINGSFSFTGRLVMRM